MKKSLQLFFIIVFLLVNTSNVFSFQNATYRIVRNSNQSTESHPFVIPGPKDSDVGRILYDIEPAGSGIITSITGNVPQDVLSREEVQAVVIPTLTAALAAWEKVPIGNLLSQIYALIYLNPVDHFVKRELGVKRYCRYVDDLMLFGLTREQCVEYRERIAAFMRDRLGLELSRTTIATVQRGVNFVGYRTWARKRFVRKHSLYTLRRSVARGKLDSVVSVLGHARRTHSLRHMIATVRRRTPAMYRALPPAYRRMTCT